MARKVQMVFSFMLFLGFMMGGVIRIDIARSADDSKLTIAYIADEIGRIEPCG